MRAVLADSAVSVNDLERHSATDTNQAAGAARPPAGKRAGDSPQSALDVLLALSSPDAADTDLEIPERSHKQRQPNDF